MSEQKDKSKKAKKEKKKKPRYEDDGHTVVDMNIEGTSWYRGKNYDPNVPKLTRKEKRAVFKGAFLSMLPAFLCTLAGFGLAILLIVLWLR